MSNTRDFSVIRRRANLVDLLTPKRADVAGYRFLAAATFNGPFTALFTAPISSGHLDSSINRATLNSVNNWNHIRAVFDPDNYTVLAGITDTQHIWIQFQPVDFAGVGGAIGNPNLILPDDELQASSTVSIRGTAPSAADISGSLTLNLPFSMKDVAVHNEETATPLYVAPVEGGPEIRIPPGEVRSLQPGSVATLVVRGGGATATFTATMANYLPL